MKQSILIKNFIIFFIAVLVFHIVLISTDNNHFYRALWYNFANIDDYKIFPHRVVEPSDTSFIWPESKKYNRSGLPQNLKDTLKNLETVAFLVIKNDSLLFEKYFQGYNHNSISNSFSMAKTFVSTLTGIAIKEGKINSVNDKVKKYLPWLKGKYSNKLKIKHLLTMSSGSNWNESYINPFSVTTRAYYGKNLKKILKKDYAINKEPGNFFNYKSGDTQLLAFLLMKATGTTLSDYASEKLWKPMGANRKALWSLDSENGNEKAYCCFNTNARNFALLGKLFLDKGICKKDTLISRQYYNNAISPAQKLKVASEEEKVDFYGYLWWLIPDFKGMKIFYARGILGQYIICIPSEDMIIVRLGRERYGKINHHPAEVYTMINGAIQLTD